MTIPTSNIDARPLLYDTQVHIFESAELHGIELADALAIAHATYDDLVYEKSETSTWTGVRPLTLSHFLRPKNTIPFVSFFTGCGGIDLGFETVGFEHTAAFEFDERFCKTLRKNRPHWQVFGPPEFMEMSLMSKKRSHN